MKENTDEDFAKDFNEKIQVEGKNIYYISLENSPLGSEMKTFQGLNPTIFSSIRKNNQLNEKSILNKFIIHLIAPFTTKMTADSLHDRYHPRNSIEIPKVEVSNIIIQNNVWFYFLKHLRNVF